MITLATYVRIFILFSLFNLIIYLFICLFIEYVCACASMYSCVCVRIDARVYIFVYVRMYAACMCMNASKGMFVGQI